MPPTPLQLFPVHERHVGRSQWHVAQFAVDQEILGFLDGVGKLDLRIITQRGTPR